MNWLDILLAVFLGVLFLIGFKKGLIGTVLPVAGVIFAIIMGLHFCGPLAGSLSGWIESDIGAKIAAFAIIVILVMAGTFALVWLLRTILRMLLMGWVDRCCGALLGLTFGGLVPAIVISLVMKLNFSAVESAVQESSLATFLVNSFNSVLSVLPTEYDAVRQFFG
jgi:membrane protein required for colicin V production